MTYSMDLKKRVLGLIAEGESKIEAARRYSVSRSAIHRWQKAPEDGSARKPGPKSSWKFDREALRRAVEAHPDRLQKEWAQQFQGTCNTAVFNVWLEQALLPKLQPGTILILDNATFYRAKSTRQLVLQAGGRLLFLPPYSPPLNPVEKWWANLKRTWRYASHLSLDAFLKMSLYFWDWLYPECPAHCVFG